MKPQLAWLLALASGLAIPLAVEAGGLRAEITVASDYPFRGYSRTGFEPALQAGFRFRHRSGFVGGAWGSTVRLPSIEGVGDAGRLELRGFAGYAVSLGQNWSGSALLIRYQHPDADPDFDISYTEIDVALQYRDLLSVTVAYTPDLFGSGVLGLFAELSGRLPLIRRLDLTTGIGFAKLNASIEPAYAYGHAGLGLTSGRLGFDLGYYFSDARPVPRWGEAISGRWVLRASARLP